MLYMYGFETQVLGHTPATRLKDSYRTFLRRVQSLPEIAAKEVVYLLMSVLPLEGILHMYNVHADRQ